MFTFSLECRKLQNNRSRSKISSDVPYNFVRHAGFGLKGLLIGCRIKSLQKPSHLLMGEVGDRGGVLNGDL